MDKYDDMGMFHDNEGRTINRFHSCGHGCGRERDHEGGYRREYGGAVTT